MDLRLPHHTWPTSPAFVGHAFGLVVGMCCHAALLAQPVHVASLTIGGTALDEARGVSFAPNGDVVVCGRFRNTVDFDPGPGATTLTALQDDAYIARYTAVGVLVWARAITGDSHSNAYAVAIDAAGALYITGTFSGNQGGSHDFDPGPGTYFMSAVGSLNDNFLLKLDGAGNFLWARRYTGSGSEVASAVALSNDGQFVYVTGYHNGADFDPPAPGGNGTGMSMPATAATIFVTKHNASTGAILWVRAANGTSAGWGQDLTATNDGGVLVTGYFQSTVDFDPMAGVFNLTSAGLEEVFLWKLDAGGNMVFARRLGGANNDRGGAVATDAAGHIYLGGRFQGTADLDPGPGVLNHTAVGGASDVDLFIQKLDASGNLLWNHVLGHSGGWEYVSGIDLDAAGNVYLTGPFNGTIDFDPGAGTWPLSSVGSADAYILILDTNGDFICAGSMGGSGSDWPNELAVDNSPSPRIGVVGWFSGSIDLDPGLGVVAHSSAGSTDGFLNISEGGPCGIVLAVELIDFRAECVAGEGVRLQWVTATETDSERFLIQRSASGSAFRTVGSVPAAGYSVSPVQYAWLDREAPGGPLYYRLVEVAGSGSADTFATVQVQADCLRGPIGLAVLHDVAHGGALLEFIATHDGDATLLVTDALGHEHWRMALQAKTGPNRAELPMERLAPGVYIAQLIQGHERRAVAFVRP